MSLSDTLLWYGKAIEHIKYREVYSDKPEREGGGWAHNSVELPDGNRIRPGVKRVKEMLESREKVRLYSLVALAHRGRSSNTSDDLIELGGKRYHPGPNHHWKTTKEGMYRLFNVG